MTGFQGSVSLSLVLLIASPAVGARPDAVSHRSPVLHAQAPRATVSRVVQPARVVRPGFVPSSVTAPESVSSGVVPQGDFSRIQSGLPFGDTDRDYSGELPVFPGAEGFGTTTRAGRGGRILRVTSLVDSGPGTLRAAVDTPGRRMVIFEVGGVIHLKSKIVVREPFLTVAGQTAPSPGITLAGDMLRFETHDVLLQHLRIRGGDDLSGDHTPPHLRDGVGIKPNFNGDPRTYNIVIDHCSISWALDENVSLWYPNVYDITVSNSIISEGLHERSPGYGMIVGHGQRRISVLRNLFAHNSGRNPKFTGDSTGLIVNNIIYNILTRAVDMGPGNGPILLSVVGNVYLPGHDSRRSIKTVVANNADPATRLYVADNLGPYFNGDPWSVVDNRVGPHIRADEPPVRVAPLTILTSEVAYERVLTTAGARRADRDAVDRRIVNNVKRGGGRVIASPSQVGGLPSTMPARSHRPLQPPARPTVDTDGDGYTDVEEWLHCLAEGVERRLTQNFAPRSCS